MNYTASTANVLIAKKSTLCLSTDLTSIKPESQLKFKEYSKTSISETLKIL